MVERTLSSISEEYTDFDFTFKVNPNFQDILPLKGRAAIDRSIKNLIFTKFYERPLNPEPSLGIEDYLFDKSDSLTKITLINEIKNILGLYEKRISNVKVFISDADFNSILISVIYGIVKTSEINQLDIPLARIR